MEHIKGRSMKWIDIAKESSESTIKRVLGREPELLLEMAMPLKVFIDRMDGLKMEMVAHWCLCEYYHLFDKGNLTFKHWRGELANFINTFRDFKIKGKVNKKKTLQKWLVEYYDYDDPKEIMGVIRSKFDVEGLMDKDRRMVVAESFASSIDSLIDIICQPLDSGMTTLEYVKNTFDLED